MNAEESHLEGANSDRAKLERLDGGAVRVCAPAKINLNLLVGPRRPDGFHAVDSIVARVTLYDVIELAPRDDGRICLCCVGADCGPDEQNLALRAARLLAEQPDRPTGQGVDIALEKNIPPGKGLGGGSSDAAAVLWALNDVWGLRLPVERLAAMAAELGSDVPLFLGPPTARVTGRGEVAERADVHPFWAVLVLPDFVCPTGEVYAAFDELGPAPAEPLDAQVLATGPPSTWRDRLVNQLTPAALAVCPPLGELMAQLQAAVSQPVCLTGSGSAVFALCDDKAEADAVLAALPSQLASCGRIVTPNPW